MIKFGSSKMELLGSLKMELPSSSILELPNFALYMMCIVLVPCAGNPIQARHVCCFGALCRQPCAGKSFVVFWRLVQATLLRHMTWLARLHLVSMLAHSRESCALLPLQQAVGSIHTRCVFATPSSKELLQQPPCSFIFVAPKTFWWKW